MSAASDEPLGRLVHEHQLADAVWGAIGAAVAGVLGIAFALRAVFAANGELAALSLFAAGTAAAAATAGVGMVWLGRLAFHENGLRQRGKALLYREIGRMTWNQTWLLRFEPLPGRGRPTIWMPCLFGGVGSSLNDMRDHAARVIARRWLGELDTVPVRWTPRLRFLRDGLEYRPAGLLGGEPATVPYHRLRWGVDGATLLLFVHGLDRDPLREALSTPNLFPGLALLEMLCPPRPRDLRGDAG